MGKFHEQFIDTMAQMGIDRLQLPMPIFSYAPVSISFEIGTHMPIYLPDGKVNPVYLENAFARAKTLFEQLPCQPDLLRIDVYPKEEVTPKSVTMQRLVQMGMPVPDESVDETYFEKDESYVQTHLYWNLADHDVPIGMLLLEIIKGDLGGTSGLCSNVYFLAEKCPLLYYLYDDRGADILAKEKACLKPLYQTYSEWILACEKEKADLVFSSCIHMRQAVYDYIKKKYQTNPDYPWRGHDLDAVFRHKENQKWFALVMNVQKQKLGILGNGSVDVLNVKIDDMLFREQLVQKDGILPAYHMNKMHWITVLLDGTVETNQIYDFIDISFLATASAKKRQTNRG